MNIIENKEQLDKYIDQIGDKDAETWYLSQHKESKECFAITGCTYASEAYQYVDDEYRLVITDGNYDLEVEKQLKSENPEMNGFYLK